MAEKKHKTLAGKIIQSVIGTADQLLTGGNLAKVIGAVTGNPELTEDDKSLVIDELNIILLDVQNARNSNVKIQETENASWLAKNTVYMLALYLCALVTWVIYILAYKEIPKENVGTLYMVLGIVIGTFTTAMAFFFGSSQGSKAKDNVAAFFKKFKK